MLEEVLTAGAHTCSIVKRHKWFLFTYNQMLKKNYKKGLLDKNGIRKISKNIIKLKQSCVIASVMRRNGYRNITLASYGR